MQYDLFISYATKDNISLKEGKPGFITEFVNQIIKEHRKFTAQPIKIFFDKDDIRDGDDWEIKIHSALRGSRLLIACISPNYFKSKWCHNEWKYFFQHESDKYVAGEGINPIYFVEVPGFESEDLEYEISLWAKDLLKRNFTDFRPWFPYGTEFLQNEDVVKRLKNLESQITSRLERINRALEAPGSVDKPSEVFVGRQNEIRNIRNILSGREKIGKLTILYGLGGIGKSALITQYAHAYASEYIGGRWLVRCEGIENIGSALKQLSVPLNIELNEDEKKSSLFAMYRILNELEKRTINFKSDKIPEPACLLILDNVDKPQFLSPEQTDLLPRKEWLHIVATTRLSPDQLYEKHRNRIFLPIDELSEEESFFLINNYQPDEKFSSVEEKESAEKIVKRLGGFPLVVETVAVYLGLHPEVTCGDFLIRLEKEGIDAPILISRDKNLGDYIRHKEKSLDIVLSTLLEALTNEERYAIEIASMLPPDNIALNWLKELTLDRFPSLKQFEVGYPHPWFSIERLLRGRRLLQETSVIDEKNILLIVKMHRLVQEQIRKFTSDKNNIEEKILKFAFLRSDFLDKNWHTQSCQWEINVLKGYTNLIFDCDNPSAPKLLLSVNRWITNYDLSISLEPVFLKSVEMIESDEHRNPSDLAEIYSGLGRIYSYREEYNDAEKAFSKALEIEIDYRGSENFFTAIRMNNLASLYTKTQRYDKAVKLYLDAYRILENSFGYYHEEVANTACHLAGLYQDVKNIYESEKYYKTCLEIRKTIFNDHPFVASTMNNYAAMLRSIGRFSEAEILFRNAVKIDDTTIGKTHPRAINRLQNLANVLIILDNLNEAKRILSEAWQLKSKKHDITSFRILFLRIVIALLESDSIELYLGQLKALFSMSPLPDFADVVKCWDVEYLMNYLKPPKLDNSSIKFLIELVKNINRNIQDIDMDNYPYWRSSIVIPLEQKWYDQGKIIYT